MRDLKACLVCFTMDAKLFSMDINQLRHQYNLLTSLQIKKGNGMPEYLCYQCFGYLRSFIKFRDKCHRAYFLLEQLLQRDNEIQIARLEAIDRGCTSTNPNLSYLDVTKSHYEEHTFHWHRSNRCINLTNDVIPIVTYTTLTKEDMFEDVVNGKFMKQDDNCVKEENMIEIDFSSYNDGDLNAQSTSSYNVDNTQVFDVNDDDNYLDSDDNQNASQDVNNVPTTSNEFKNEAKISNKKLEADGSVLETEYATMHAISRNEAQAALEIMKMVGQGQFKCEICKRSYKNEQRLKVHLRMHDQHMSGNHLCEICNYYYKTSFLLKTHMTEKHMFKYLCNKCPEVSFDRTSAKQHYIFAHLEKRKKTEDEWEISRPSWMSQKGGRRIKGVRTVVRPGRSPVRGVVRPGRKRAKVPDDFPVYTPVRHEDQYSIIQERKNSRNYLESPYKCDMCFRGYREQETYNKHMRKHDPAYAGAFQCDMCKLYFKDLRKMYKHMSITHLFKYSCQVCNYICFNRGQAITHYRWHKNVTYKCPHCTMEFKKLSTRLTHVRIKHPSSFICNLCGNTFVSDSGLYCHKQISHTAEEVEASLQVAVDKSSSLYCTDCDVLFFSQSAYDTHLASAKKHVATNFAIACNVRERARAARQRGGRARRSPAASEVLNNGMVTSSNCEICNKFLVNDVQARKHYSTEHPGKEYLKRYMCDVCGHITKQYANLIVHMRTHTNEKPYQCPHCDRRFSMPSNRDRHIVVHTGEKRYQCHQCHRRFTQSSAVKLHIQTVHLKIPYAPWDKKNRKRRKELEGTAGPMSTVTVNLPPQPKIILDQDYLNAYINYNDE